MQNLDDVYQTIKRSYIWFLVFSFLLLVWSLFQQDPSGAHSADYPFRYVMEMASILLVCVMVPLSLKLFHLFVAKRIQKMNLQEALGSYLKWSLLRLLMLLLPVIAGCLTHVLCRPDNNVMSSTGFLVMVVALIAASFCVPSKERMKSDLNLDDGASQESNS